MDIAWTQIFMRSRQPFASPPYDHNHQNYSGIFVYFCWQERLVFLPTLSDEYNHRKSSLPQVSKPGAEP